MKENTGLIKRKGTSGYVLGRAREWNLGNKLRKKDFLIFRMPQSKGGLPQSKVKPIDLIAMKSELKRPIFIQVSKRLRDITQEEIDELMKVSEIAGADPILAYVKDKEKERSKWRFKDPKTMKETKLY